MEGQPAMRTLWLKASLMTTMVIVVCGQADAQYRIAGREFYLAFMGLESNWDNYDGYRHAYAYITNRNDMDAWVTVEYIDSTTASQTYKISPQVMSKETFPSDVILTGSRAQTKSVRITSDVDILVQASLEYNDNQEMSLAGYSVLPTSSLTGEYIVATHCYTNYCVFLVTAVENGVDVTVTLRITASGRNYAVYEGLFLQDGDVYTTSLQAGESMQMKCYTCDLTGTHISASGKVAVFSGGDFTMYGPERGHQDVVAEQMVPKETLGQTYVLGNNYVDVMEIVKVVVLNAGDSFIYDGAARETAGTDRQVYTMPSRYSSEPLVITSDSPILVVQIIASDSTYTYPDMSMVIAVPTFQWSMEYQVYLPIETAYSSAYVSLILDQPTASLIETPGSPASNTETDNGFVSSPYTFMTMEFSGSQLLTIQCVEAGCQPFTGFVALNQDRMSSVFPLQSRLSHHPFYVPTTEAVPTTTTTTTPTTTTTTPTTAPTTTTQASTTTSEETTTLRTTTEVTTPPMATTNAVTTLQTTTEVTTPPMATPNAVTTLQTTTEVTTPPPMATTNAVTALQTTTEVTTPPMATPNAVTTLQTTTEEATPPMATTNAVTTPSTATEKVTTSQASVSTSRLSSYSKCRCVQNVAPPNTTAGQEEDMKLAIQQELLADTTKLSSHVRAKTSAQDERTSSTVIGSTVGIVLVAVGFSVIVLPDLVRVCSYLLPCGA